MGVKINGLDELIIKKMKFRTIYIDPPWPYKNQKTRGATKTIYKNWDMSIDEICSIPVDKLLEDKARVFLWTTNAFIFECPKIFKSWGVEYKGIFLWVKPQMGMGNYWRISHEFLILAIKGTGLTFKKNRSVKSWAQYPRRKHSEKPDEIREMIQSVSDAPGLEIFARKNADKWTCIGDEISK